jgi:hypothetical protein
MRGDNLPVHPFAVSEHFVLSRELCFHITEIRNLQQELQQIAATFDDEALPQLIRKLEALLPNGSNCQGEEQNSDC